MNISLFSLNSREVRERDSKTESADISTFIVTQKEEAVTLT